VCCRETTDSTKRDSFDIRERGFQTGSTSPKKILCGTSNKFDVGNHFLGIVTEGTLDCYSCLQDLSRININRRWEFLCSFVKCLKTFWVEPVTLSTTVLICSISCGADGIVGSEASSPLFSSKRDLIIDNRSMRSIASLDCWPSGRSFLPTSGGSAKWRRSLGVELHEAGAVCFFGVTRPVRELTPFYWWSAAHAPRASLHDRHEALGSVGAEFGGSFHRLVRVCQCRESEMQNLIVGRSFLSDSYINHSHINYLFLLVSPTVQQRDGSRFHSIG